MEILETEKILSDMILFSYNRITSQDLFSLSVLLFAAFVLHTMLVRSFDDTEKDKSICMIEDDEVFNLINKSVNNRVKSLIDKQKDTK
jgi:hypothetical protein